MPVGLWEPYHTDKIGEILAGQISLDAPFKMLLLDQGYIFNVKHDMSDIAPHELPDGDGYEKGGADATLMVKFLEALVFTLTASAKWEEANFSVKHAVVVDPSDLTPIMHLDLDIGNCQWPDGSNNGWLVQVNKGEFVIS